MTVLLEEAFEKVSKLPKMLQDEIAKELLAEIENESHWHRVSENVKHLLESGDVTGARHLLSAIQPGASTEIDHWQRVLSEPRVSVTQSSGKTNIRKDDQWLKDNSGKYRGKWIALKNGKLLGAHESRIQLHQTLKQAANLSEAVFFRIDH